MLLCYSSIILIIKTHVQHTRTVNVRDTNDNKPVFSQQSYGVYLRGGSHIGRSILKVIATDADDGSNGKVSYDMEESADSKM